MKTLSTHITEALMTEAKSVKLKGLTFKYSGDTHEIAYTDGDVVTTTKGKEFRISTLEKHGTSMPEKEIMKKTAWNKGDISSDKLISKAEYNRLCKDAAMRGGAENAYDLAQSMFLNRDIRRRLLKDNPFDGLDALKERLQWDIEAYSY